MGRETQLFIKVGDTWKEVDLFDNVTIPITLKVSDIRQFGSKTSGYSSDFEIPHTNNNAQVFGLQADIDAYESTFEFGRDYEARLLTNSLSTFCGQFRLKKVFKQYEGKNIYYIGYLYGGSKNFINQLGNQTLIGNDDANDDLSFSEYDTPAEDMTLGDFAQRLLTPLGWGLTLIDKTNKAQVSFVGNAQEWYADECTPYVFVKHILDKIFDKTGYRYVSDFLTQEVWAQINPKWADTIGKFAFLDLVYPYMRHNSNIKTLNPSSTELFQITSNANSELFKTSVPPADQYPSGEWNAWNGTYNNYTVNFDSNDYNITSTGVNIPLTAWRFVCPSTGIYTINVNLPVKVKTQFYMDFYERIIVGPNKNTTNQTDQKFTYWISLMKNNRNIVQLAQTQNYPAHYTLDANGWTTLVPQQELSYSGNVMLAAGDVIQIYCAIELDWYKERWYEPEGQYYKIYAFRGPEPTEATALRPVNITFESLHNSQTDSIINITQNDGFYEEAFFTPNTILNPKTTKVDFIGNLLKMFNLYVEDVSGKTNYKLGGVYPENTLRIEPYEIFYNPQIMNGLTNIHDWTHKIDWATLEYRRIDDYLYNIQQFTKEQNNDFYDEDYNATYRMPYGDRRVKGVYCTNDDTNEIAVKNGAYLCGVVNSQTDTLQCPKAFSIANNGSIDEKKEYSDGIFFIWRNEMPSESDIGVNTKINLRSRLSASAVVVDDYNVADTLNDGYGRDTANLNFGRTETSYQNLKGGNPTNNDLFNAFYKKQYDEMTAPDARAIRCKAYLTALDIATLQLSDTIVVKGNAYRVGEILQWQDEYTPCEIELIKVVP